MNEGRPDLIDVETATLQAAETYRELFFDMQLKFWAEEKKNRKQKAIMTTQREIIRNLEARLGIDDEL